MLLPHEAATPLGWIKPLVVVFELLYACAEYIAGFVAFEFDSNVEVAFVGLHRVALGHLYGVAVVHPVLVNHFYSLFVDNGPSARCYCIDSNGVPF